jgi:hypothetical protein
MDYAFCIPLHNLSEQRRSIKACSFQEFDLDIELCWGRFTYLVRTILDGEVPDWLSLLHGLGNLDHYTICELVTKNPYLIAGLENPPITLTHSVSVNAISKEVVEQSKGVKRYCALLKHKLTHGVAAIEVLL